MGDVLSADSRVEDDATAAESAYCPEQPADSDIKSPESRSSCFYLFGSHSPWATAPARARPNRDIEEMKSGMDGLKQSVEEMHTALLALRRDNLDLQRENRTLADQNTHLQRTLADEAAAKLWSDFDVVEEHYRQIERHRAGADVRSCDADFAAGISLAVADPWKQAPQMLLGAESLPRQHCIASPVWSARHAPPVLEQAPAEVF